MTIKDSMKVSLTDSKKVYEIMTDSKKVYEIMREVHDQLPEQDKSKEHFWILGLNTKNVINYIELVSMGTMSSAGVHPREVFKFAIMKNSASIIACHNHPSGDPDPSKDDITITKRLVETGKVIGIQLIDHIILGAGSYLSMMEKGRL